MAGDAPFEQTYPPIIGLISTCSSADAFKRGQNDSMQKRSWRRRSKALVRRKSTSTYCCTLARADEAAAAARQLLMQADDRQLSCPGALELTRRQSNFSEFAEVARTRGDAVHFLAGLLAKSGSTESQRSSFRLNEFCDL